MKIEGLSEEDARRPIAPSTMSLLGIAKHLALVERYWFQEVFAGREVDYPWTDEDPNADFRIEEGESVASVLTLYRAEAAKTDEIVTGAGLGDTTSFRKQQMTLRWILAHLVEETARHNGHADIFRESIDGSKGIERVGYAGGSKRPFAPEPAAWAHDPLTLNRRTSSAWRLSHEATTLASARTSAGT